MTKREQAFKLFDEGAEPAEIAEKLDIKKDQVAAYKYNWKKARGTVSADDLADAIFGSDEEVKQAGKLNPEFEQAIQDMEKKPLDIDQKKLKEAPGEASKKWLVEQSRTVTYKGVYGHYEVTNQCVEANFEVNEFGFDKETLSGFIEELQEVYQTIGGMEK